MRDFLRTDMTKKERFHATLEHRPVDRPASWLVTPDRPGLIPSGSYSIPTPENGSS